MSWTCKEVLAKLGDEAQVTARGIIVLADSVAPDGGPAKKHLLVAEFVGDSFQMTAEGLEFLELSDEQDAPAADKAKKPRGLKKEKAVESIDDIDLED